MFYCKYCKNNRDDNLISIIYKQSIKCDICVKNGVKLSDRRNLCECGISHINNHTTLIAHQKSKIHTEYIKKNFIELSS